MLTESAPSKQRISVFECSSLPPWILEIVGKQADRHGLFLVPGCHAPQATQDRLLLESEIVQRAVDRILLLGFGVFVASHNLELCSL